MVSTAERLAGGGGGSHDQRVFTAFVLIVLIAFVTITCRTYYRRWRNSRGRIDPGAAERSRLQRGKNDSSPYIGPHSGPPPGGSGGSGF